MSANTKAAPERVKAIQLPNGSTAQAGPQQVQRIVASATTTITLEGNRFTVQVKSGLMRPRTFKLPMSAIVWYEPLTDEEAEAMARPAAVMVETQKPVVQDSVKFVKNEDGTIVEVPV